MRGLYRSRSIVFSARKEIDPAMQPATARPFVSRRPPQSSPPPELEAPAIQSSPADAEEYRQSSSDTSVMLAYLVQQGMREEIEGIFRSTAATENTKMIRSCRVADDGSDDLLGSCWRFAAGHGVYLGPVPYQQISHPDDGLVLGPGSIALADGAQCSVWQQGDVAGAWEGWDTEERQVYTDVRAASLWVCREWFTANGHDADECCGSLEIRLMCARYASNAVERFRQWREDVLGGRKGEDAK